jgi:hypothetical protein
VHHPSKTQITELLHMSGIPHFVPVMATAGESLPCRAMSQGCHMPRHQSRTSSHLEMQGHVQDSEGCQTAPLRRQRACDLVEVQVPARQVATMI